MELRQKLRTGAKSDESYQMEPSGVSVHTHVPLKIIVSQFGAQDNAYTYQLIVTVPAMSAHPLCSTQRRHHGALSVTATFRTAVLLGGILREPVDRLHRCCRGIETRNFAAGAGNFAASVDVAVALEIFDPRSHLQVFHVLSADVHGQCACLET
jgi:hypothetical protein